MVSSNKLADALLVLSEERGEEKAIEQFLGFVRERNLGYLLPHVVHYLETKAENVREQSRAYVTTSHEVSPEILQRITEKIGAEGKEVVHAVNPDLIGGFRASFNNTQYDGSLERALSNLRKELTQ